MPLLRIETSGKPPAAVDEWLADLSAVVSRETGKPESYVMIVLAPPPARMTFAGSAEPACFAELANVGKFSPAAAHRLCAALTERLAAKLAIPPERIYVSLREAEGRLWGHAGQPFA